MTCKNVTFPQEKTKEDEMKTIKPLALLETLKKRQGSQTGTKGDFVNTVAPLRPLEASEKTEYFLTDNISSKHLLPFLAFRKKFDYCSTSLNSQPHDACGVLPTSMTLYILPILLT